LNKIGNRIWTALAATVLITSSGCKSYWVDASVENHTGQPIHELEVDYPTASFGINTLAPEAAMHYRFQIRGSGPVKVEYAAPDGKTTHAQALTLTEGEQGQLTIRLLPLGKIEVLPKLQPAS
jgi:hypothetical protein